MKKLLLIGCWLGMGVLKSLAQQAAAPPPLSVQVDVPPFLYEGDRLEATATITNNSDTELTGQAILQLTDATNQASVDGWFQNVFPVQYFTVAAGTREAVRFPFEVPYLFKKTLRWKVLLQAGNYMDSASAAIPVLTNQRLFAHALSVPVPSGARSVRFEKLLQADPSIEHHSLTFELFQNPIWHVAEALPQFRTTGEDAGAVWNRLFAYKLAQKINAHVPEVAQTIAGWKNQYAEAAGDQQKENTVLQEAPDWRNDATDNRKQSLALLFDSSEQPSAQENEPQKLKQLQLSNGGFSWFSHGPADLVVTRSIVTGMGHLKRLNALGSASGELSAMLVNSLHYLDDWLAKEYRALKDANKQGAKRPLTPDHIHYLYTRSFFPELPVPETALAAYRFYQQQAARFWKGEPKSLQACIALALHRSGDKKTPLAILQSVATPAMEASGKKRAAAFDWWQNLAIEKAVSTEAFTEIKNDTLLVPILQSALIAEKGLFDWGAANATVFACYALLLEPTFKTTKTTVRIDAGSAAFSTAAKKGEWKAGYFKESIQAPHVAQSMGNLKISTAPSEPRAEAPLNVYWRFFQSADSANGLASGITIRKQFFVKRPDKNEPVSESTVLHVGDTILVRLTAAAAQNVAHVTVKDRHAANLTPIDLVRSNAEKRRGVFYKPTGTATEIVVPAFKKGSSVFEYLMLITHSGTFNDGGVTIQGLYTSAAVAQSPTLRIQVE